MQLLEIKELKGKIILKSGLHIGVGTAEMHIGGIDMPVVKHPHTQEPYIPGSSLKGKVRSLLEMESGLMIYTRGSVVSMKTLNAVQENEKLKKSCEAILKIFGSSGADQQGEESALGPTRVSFSDCFLEPDWLKKAREENRLLTEQKSENTINRITGTAEHPRFIERVPEGTVFSFLVTFKVLAEGEENLFRDYILKGLKLLEMDTLGGSGSRGYGRIKFEFEDAEIQKQFDEINPFAKN